jgi:hypothetical protein
MRKAAVAILCVFAVVTASAQTSLEDALKQYSGDAVKGYIQPVADLFGANMHAGFYQTADIPKMGFVFSFDIVGMVALVGDDQKSYNATAPPGFTPAQYKTSTIFGGKATEVSNTTNPSLKYRGSDGIFNTSIFPLAVPQVTIGSIYGTVATVRFLTVPKIGDDKVPDVTLWGIGVRHNVSQYFPKLPLSISVGVHFNSFTAGDLVSFKGFAFGAQASKSFSVLTLYGGLGYEKSTMTLKYTSTDPSVPASVSVDLDGANTFRFTGGLKLSLGFFKLFADANLGAVTHFSGGIGFGF